jgi:hypothetical protein
MLLWKMQLDALLEGILAGKEHDFSNTQKRRDEIYRIPWEALETFSLMAGHFAKIEMIGSVENLIGFGIVNAPVFGAELG